MSIFKTKRKEKRPDFNDMEMAFTDSEGDRYYKYIRDMDIPIIRMTHLQVYLQEMGAGLDRNEIDIFVDAMDKALTREVEGKMSPDIGLIGFLVKEMKDRRTVLVHEDILFGMVSCLYIREDQNPAVWDAEIEEQKITQFKKDSKGGLYDFFYGAGLSKYMPYFEKLKDDLPLFLRKAKRKVETMGKILESYGLDAKSLDSLKPEKSN